MAQTTALTSFSIACSIRVIRCIQAMVKGTNPHADQAFEMVARILETIHADKSNFGQPE